MSAASHHRLIRIRRAMSRAVRRTPIRLAIWALLALVATWPMLRQPSMNVFRDAQVLIGYEDAARKSVVEFGEALPALRRRVLRRPRRR